MISGGAVEKVLVRLRGLDIILGLTTGLRMPAGAGSIKAAELHGGVLSASAKKHGKPKWASPHLGGTGRRARRRSRLRITRG